MGEYYNATSGPNSSVAACMSRYKGMNLDERQFPDVVGNKCYGKKRRQAQDFTNELFTGT